MGRLAAFSTAFALMFALMVAAPAAGGTRTDVTMTVTTIFDPAPDAFVATGLGSDCAWGLVDDGGAHLQFTPGPGIFAGYKVFMCEGGDTNGFVARLNARFGPSGSVGTWSIVAAWGSLGGMSGAGKLTGDPIDNGITDNYFGTVTF